MPFRNNVENNRLFNSGSELNSITGNYETLYRNYDPALGRFASVDPMAGAYTSWSPYNFALNDPVYWNDPNGDCPNCDAATEWMLLDGLYQQDGTGGGSYNGYGGRIGIGSGNHWSDQYRSWEGNMMLMSTSTFENFYNVDITSDQGKFDFANRVGTSVNIHFSSSDLSVDPTVINTGAANTAWIFDGKLVDVTNGGTLVWGDYYGDPHVINGASVRNGDLFASVPNREPYKGIGGALEYIWTGGNEDGIMYDRDGMVIGASPTIGEPMFGAGGSAKGVIRSLKSIRNFPKTAKNVWSLVRNSGFSDWYRTGQTVISNQLIHGAGSTGASVAWGIKGGGKLAKTGQSMGFHYHIHKFNWYTPWTWFKNTPIIKP